MSEIATWIMLKLKETLKVLPLSQSPTGLLRTMTFTVSVFDIRTSLLIPLLMEILREVLSFLQELKLAHTYLLLNVGLLSMLIESLLFRTCNRETSIRRYLEDATSLSTRI